MLLQNEMMEIGKERLTQMKVFLEDLQVQMALGKAEAKDAFERERRNVNEYVRDLKTQTKTAQRNDKDDRLILKDKLMAFHAQISKAAPASSKSFELWKKNTLHAIYELEFAMKEGYGRVGFTMQTRLDALKPKLDAFRIDLALGQFQAYESLVKPMEELVVRTGEMQEKLNKEEKASEKIDTFAEELNQSFDHMKKAFGELFS